MTDFSKMTDGQIAWFWIARILVAMVLIVSLGMWGCPKYQVYEQNLTGEAELARAQQNRQIRIAEAEATARAAIMQAEARVTMARADAQAKIEASKGVAEANRQIGASLKDNPDYLKFLYIESLERAQTMYVPTEGGFPIFLKQFGKP